MDLRRALRDARQDRLGPARRPRRRRRLRGGREPLPPRSPDPPDVLHPAHEGRQAGDGGQRERPDPVGGGRRRRGREEGALGAGVQQRDVLQKRAGLARGAEGRPPSERGAGASAEHVPRDGGGHGEHRGQGGPRARLRGRISAPADHHRHRGDVAIVESGRGWELPQARAAQDEHVEPFGAQRVLQLRAGAGGGGPGRRRRRRDHRAAEPARGSHGHRLPWPRRLPVPVGELGLRGDHHRARRHPRRESPVDHRGCRPLQHVLEELGRDADHHDHRRLAGAPSRARSDARHSLKTSRLPTAPPRGMRDILPDEVELRDAAVREIIAVYLTYGFRRIETPALEHLTLLAGSEGGENEKLIFKVMKRGEELESARRAGEDVADLGLRFDLTVPLARYYAENHAQLPDPLKAIQIGPVWRAERPQKGRYRQFTQCDIDVLGAVSPLVEIELILATCEALRAAFGLPELTVRINDRRILSRIARHCGFAEREEASFFIAFDKLDKVGAEGVLAELREAGRDARAIERFERLLPALQKGDVSLKALGSALGAGDEPAFAWLATISAGVAGALPSGARLQFDPTLVRGMGYYTGTIFEVVMPGFSGSVAGGGRYDRMVGKLLGRDVPACGFSIGFERLVAILGERGGALDACAPARAQGRRLARGVADRPDAGAGPAGGR